VKQGMTSIGTLMAVQNLTQRAGSATKCMWPCCVARRKAKPCSAMHRLLTPDHGFPCRLIIPGHIGGRMVKWLEVRCVLILYLVLSMIFTLAAR